MTTSNTAVFLQAAYQTPGFHKAVGDEEFEQSAISLHFQQVTEWFWHSFTGKHCTLANVGIREVINTFTWV
ncbi:hypothetical protein RQN30_11200 [Arcanobacterium hippocoleae]